jgi:hypothetical protein
MFDKLKELFALGQRPLIELDIDEIPNFISNEFASEINQEKKKLSTTTEEIYTEFLSLKDLINKLKEKQHEAVFANSVKNKFCCRSLEMIENLEKPEMTYKLLRSFLDKSEDLIKNISNLGFKEMIHLRAFKEQMDSIANKTKLIISKNKIASDFIKGAILEKLDKIGDKIKSIKNHQETVEALSRYIKTTENDIADLENELIEKKKKLDDFLKNDNFIKFNQFDDELEELEKEKGIIKQKIATEFSGIGKVLKKFQHSDFATREEGQIINNYITDSDAFLLDKNLEIKRILEKVKQKIDSRELDAEEKRHDKILYLLKEFNSLTAIRNEYEEIEKTIVEKNEQKNKLLPLFGEKARYEKSIDDAQKGIAEMIKKRNSLVTETKSMEEVIEEGRNDLEFMVRSLLNSDVSVRL